MGPSKTSPVNVYKYNTQSLSRRLISKRKPTASGAKFAERRKKKEQTTLNRYSSIKSIVDNDTQQADESKGDATQSGLQKYNSEKFKTPVDYFKKWTVRELIESQNDWQNRVSWTSLYIVANTHQKYQAQTYIGRVSNFELEARFSQLNGDAHGGPNETKRIHGYCVLLFYMTFPPYRNYSTDEIADECKQRRGWKSRCLKAIEMTFLRGLQFKVSKHLFDKTSPFYSDQVIEQLQHYFPTMIPHNPDSVPVALSLEHALPNINNIPVAKVQKQPARVATTKKQKKKIAQTLQ